MVFLENKKKKKKKEEEEKKETPLPSLNMVLTSAFSIYL